MAEIVDTQSDRYVVKLSGGGLLLNMQELYGNESDDNLNALTETVFENSDLYSPNQYNVGHHVDVEFIWLDSQYQPNPPSNNPPQG